MACVRKPREQLFASAFHPSITQKQGTKSGRLRRPLCVRGFRVLEGVERARALLFFEVFARRPLLLSNDIIIILLDVEFDIHLTCFCQNT